MAITTVPVSSGVCKIVSQMADKDIVLATSEDDFKDWSACEIGGKIADLPAMVGDGYDYLVLNPGSDCIERYPKPAPPVYNSELLNPWFGGTHWSGYYSTGAGFFAHHKLSLPVFAYDVYLMASFSIAVDNGIYVQWQPFGPIQTPGLTYGTGSGEFETPLPVVGDASNWGLASYYKKVFVKAGQSNLKLDIYFTNAGGGGWGQVGPGSTSITAIAFKA